VRAVFAGFAMEALETTCTISTVTTGAGTRAGELIVRGRS
jgi:hypothetical protein